MRWTFLYSRLANRHASAFAPPDLLDSLDIGVESAISRWHLAARSSDQLAPTTSGQGEIENQVAVRRITSFADHEHNGLQAGAAHIRSL